MISATLLIKRFGKAGEKTGWYYVEISPSMATRLNPGVKKSYRIKGTLDNLRLSQQAILPMGGGAFILPIKGEIRKKLGKEEGDKVKIAIEPDNSEVKMDSEFLLCLDDDTEAKTNFYKFPPSHRSYFSKWIASAKTVDTKSKRIALSLSALARGMNFAEMLREAKKMK